MGNSPTATGHEALKRERRRNREIRESREAAKLGRTNDLLESTGMLSGVDWTSSFYAFLDRWNQFQLSFSGVSTINDRRWGRDYPIYTSEVDLQLLRWPSRIVCRTNSYAIGMQEGLTSYVVGDGPEVSVQAKQGKEEQIPKPILAKLNEVTDEFADRNCWHGADVPGLAEELFQRGEEDGEYGLCLWEDDYGQCWADTFEPEQLTQPPGSDMDYLFGVYTPRGSQRAAKYWLRGLNTPEGGREYNAEQIAFFRNNVYRQMKRGIPSFSFSSKASFELADDLRQALGKGAKIQAGIAVLRQWESGTKQEAQNFTQAFSEFTMPMPGGATVPAQLSTPGQVLDAPKGMSFAPPPNAQNAQAHVAILNAVLRGGVARWNAPVWIASGDASENSYANALAYESPFARRVIRTQRRHEEVTRRVFWWALDRRCQRQGEVVAVGPDGQVYRMTWDELKKLVDVVVKFTPPEVRKKLEETQVATLAVQAGIMSPQEAIEERGGDVQQVISDRKAWEKEFPQQGGSTVERNADGLPVGIKKPSVSMQESLALLEFTGVDSHGHQWVDGKQVKRTDLDQGTGGKEKKDDAGGETDHELSHEEHTGEHIAQVATKGIKQKLTDKIVGAVGGLDDESLGGVSAILHGVKTFNPIEVARGVGGLVSTVFKCVHEEMFETALAAGSGISGAAIVGKLTAKALTHAEMLILKGAAAAFNKLRGTPKPAAVTESEEPKQKLSKIDDAILSAATEQALDALRQVYEMANVEDKVKLPDAAAMRARLAKSLGVAA